MSDDSTNGTGKHVASVIETLIQWGSLVAIAFFLSQSVAALAGQDTNATIDLAADIAGKFSLGSWVAWVSLGAAVVWGYVERRLRKREEN